MSNSIILTSEKKSMFINAGNAKGGRMEISGQGTFMSIVGDTFVNVEASEDYQDQIKDLLNKESLIAEFDISDTAKQHIITCTYNKTYRSVAIIGITDIIANLNDREVTKPIDDINVKGIGVKLINTQVDLPDFISDRVIFIRTEKETSKSKKTKRKLKIYLFSQG